MRSCTQKMKEKENINEEGENSSGNTTGQECERWGDWEALFFSPFFFLNFRKCPSGLTLNQCGVGGNDGFAVNCRSPANSEY